MIDSVERHIALSPLGAEAVHSDDIVQLIVQSSLDEALPLVTYLPAQLNEEEARRFCDASDGFVLREQGVPIGVVLLHKTPNPGEGVTLPPGCVETESWLLAPYRGQGLLRRVWPQLVHTLAARFDYLVAVCWADNRAALASVAARGYKRLGLSYWSDGIDEGFCEVWLYDLRDHRPRKK